MSGYHTHMLIGAVGGLSTYKAVDLVAPSAIAMRITVANQVYPVPPVIIGSTWVVASALLALWPDIDEPRSWISHRAIHLMWLLGAILGLIFAMLVSESLIVIVMAPFFGAIVGLIGGGVFLRFLRFLSGGHRRLTHSMIVGFFLFILAGALLFIGSFVRFAALSVFPFAFAWGQMLHLVGDIVTPEGVPLLYPFSRRDIHVFPRYIAQFGELIVGISALLVGFVALWL